MRESRSASQILFGFLPSQTVDLANRVWKVSSEWPHAIMVDVDQELVRNDLLRVLQPWATNGRDGGLSKYLRQQRPFRVYELNHTLGITVESFPDTWQCRTCNRVYNGKPERCSCGSERLGQLPFVGFHDCGRIIEPRFPQCPQHHQARMVNGGSAALSDIEFSCPVCAKVIRRGFTFGKCPCGAGNYQFNVHRASGVYTPRNVVIVNPPSPDHVQRIRNAGGGARALGWILGGLKEETFEAGGTTATALIDTLVSQGITRDVAEKMAQLAQNAGQTRESNADVDLDSESKAIAENSALRIALGLSGSRRRVSDLRKAVPDTSSERGALYGVKYPNEIRLAGLEDVELVTKFPILTANYAYNRGGSGIGEGTLVPFQRTGFNGFVAYGELAETEALFVRLSPQLVAEWLRRRGHRIPNTSDARAARAAILRAARIPSAGDSTSGTVGSDVLTLVHSYAHRFIRRAAVYAGIDRNALSEFVVPEHLAFFMYAGARGDFVLGGLEAVFESELHQVLGDVVRADHRCALDPGCAVAGAACIACLHVGEPSCRYFNQFLDRRTLFGGPGSATGFLVMAR